MIEHFKLGTIIFDTGYSKRFYQVTEKFPFKFYKWATPVYHREEQSCINKIQSMGMKHTDINHIVISHFHADHIGGLKDFPGSQKWFSSCAWRHFEGKSNWSGVVSAYLKPLVPKKIKANYPDEMLTLFDWNGFKAWKWDDDVFFIDLPGHSRGQIGLFLKNTNLGDVFLLADASWSMESIRKRIYPSNIVRIFVDDYKQLSQTIDKLHDLHKNHPDLIMIPAHCSEIANFFKL